MTILLLASGCRNESSWELEPGIYILDKATPVESWAELAARLPSKAIYVDRWATWCAPCLEELYDQLIKVLGIQEE